MKSKILYTLLLCFIIINITTAYGKACVKVRASIFNYSQKSANISYGSASHGEWDDKPTRASPLGSETRLSGESDGTMTGFEGNFTLSQKGKNLCTITLDFPFANGNIKTSTSSCNHKRVQVCIFNKGYSCGPFVSGTEAIVNVCLFDKEKQRTCPCVKK